MFSVNPLKRAMSEFSFLILKENYSISLYIANISMNLNVLFLSFKIVLKRGIRS